MASVKVETEVEIEIDNIIDDVLEEIESDDLFAELMERGFLNGKLHEIYDLEEMIDGISGHFNLIQSERIRNFFEELENQ